MSAYALVCCIVCAVIQIIVAIIDNSDIYDTLSNNSMIDFIMYLVIVPEGIQLALRQAV